MLKTRIVTAICLLIGLFSAVFFAPFWLWASLTCLVALLALNEWSNLIALSATAKSFYMLIAFVGTILLVLELNGSYPIKHQVSFYLLAAASFFWCFLAPIWLIKRFVSQHRLMMALLGLILVGATCTAMIGLHAINPWLLLALIAGVAIADSAAFFAGKKFGKRKLAPEISPGKTWEGVGGALLGITIYGVALVAAVGISAWLIVLLWGLVVLSIVGDLFESLLKRRAGLKDSGHLLPGHGGILDRIDGLLPTLSVAMFLVSSNLSGAFGISLL